MADETLRMGRIGLSQDTDPLELGLVSTTKVHIGRRVKADTGVAVLVVVPAKETLAESTAILHRAEPSRELGPVFERLEVRL